MKRILRGVRFREKGFTLIELLVVIAILGALAAVAIPRAGKFIGQGISESYKTELHNIQTAVMSILVESTTGLINPLAVQPTADMDLVGTTDTTPLLLSAYITGFNTYAFDQYSGVAQTIP